MEKKFLFTLSTVAIAASIIACTQEITASEEPETLAEVNEVELSINASGVDTKTYIDGTDVKWASTGEYLYVYELATPTEGDVVTTNKKSSQGTTTDSGATMNFVTSLAEKSSGYTNFDYYAFYPAEARQSGTTPLNVNIETSPSQTPTATSFDPKADLLIARPILGESSQSTSLDMEFGRAVAVGKITITDLPSDESVTEVHFSAVDDGEDVVLAGRTSFNLSTGAPVTDYANNKADNVLVLDYSALSLTADTSMDVFFTCYPFDLAAGDSFTLVVKTDTYTYTRTVSLTGSQAISFKAGKASRFSVNMSSAVETVNAQDIPYAILTYDAAVSADLAANYATGSTTDIVGGKWEWNAYKGSGIQLKNKTATSYIKSPVFKDVIRKVVINLSNAYSGKYLRFDSVPSSYTGDIYSLTLTSDTEYEIDFEGESISVNTFYLHAVDAAVNIESIEVYAGDDNSVQLATPTGVTAALTDDGAGGTVANSVTVTWTAVDHADYYVVTLTPTSGDPVSSKVNTVSATISGLNYETTYSVGVVAYANNKGLYSASTAGTCSDVATDEEPAGAHYYTKVSASLSDWSGTYLIVAAGHAAAGAIESKWLTTAEVSISDNKILSDATVDKYAVEIEKVGENDYYTIHFSGGYLGTTNNNNGINISETAGTNYYWTFSYSDSLVKISSNAFTSRFLSNVKDTYLFRTYTSVQTGGAQATLYKYE